PRCRGSPPAPGTSPTAGAGRDRNGYPAGPRRPPASCVASRRRGGLAARVDGAALALRNVGPEVQIALRQALELLAGEQRARIDQQLRTGSLGHGDIVEGEVALFQAEERDIRWCANAEGTEIIQPDRASRVHGGAGDHPG